MPIIPQLAALAAPLAALGALGALGALAAGCYAPRIAPGGACTTACPGDLECVGGVCVDMAMAPDGDPSLVAHWRFDDPPEDGALDSSGRGHDATCDECPEPVPGRLGGGYRFDATFEEILVVPDHPDFRGAYTIAAWIYAESTPEQIAILSKPFGTGTGNAWQLEVLPDDRISLSGGVPHSVRSPGPLAPGEWHHVVGSWDGTAKALFIDGALVGQGAAIVEYDDHAVYLGGDQNSGVEVLHWDGVLDDLRVYNRALSAAEIQELAR
jgi:hypothetical protein